MFLDTADEIRSEVISLIGSKGRQYTSELYNVYVPAKTPTAKFVELCVDKRLKKVMM